MRDRRAVVGDSFDFVSGPEVTARLNDDFSDDATRHTTHLQSINVDITFLNKRKSEASRALTSTKLQEASRDSNEN